MPSLPGGVTAEVLSSVEAEAAQRRAAGALQASGLGSGDRVVFCLPSSANLLCAVLGALRVGIVPVLLNATLTDHERRELIDDARPGLAVTDPGQLALLAGGPPTELAPYPLGRPMHYTSGTTGRSKGVWSGLWDESTAEAAFRDEADLWAFSPDDVHLVCSPMYHSVSIRFAAGTLLSGGTCLVLSRFDAKVALSALRGAHGSPPTTTFMAPAALGRLLDETDAQDRDAECFGSLRLLVHAGSPCPPALKRRAMSRVGEGVLWEFYGSTEGQFTVCPPNEWMDHPGSVGRARTARTLSVDPDGTIWCKAPDFARFRYWRDEVKTTAAWRDGSFTVGDLGRLDADGYLFLDGRRDDLIISGGVNVYPAEVEAVLGDVEGVGDLAVFGLPDDRWGQRVCAAVVPADGSTAATGSSRSVQSARGVSLVDAVRACASERLAPYKQPKQYVLLESLPRTATGKIQRNLIPHVVDETVVEEILGP
jgi:long-chain acyl-CoA synthetase